MLEILPRAEGPGYPLHLRTRYHQDKSQLKTVNRFVPTTTYEW